MMGLKWKSITKIIITKMRKKITVLLISPSCLWLNVTAFDTCLLAEFLSTGTTLMRSLLAWIRRLQLRLQPSGP